MLITLVTNFVPSAPDSQGTFLNQGEIDAMPSVAPEISFKIWSNFLFSQGENMDPYLAITLHLCLLQFTFANSIAFLLKSEA